MTRKCCRIPSALTRKEDRILLSQAARQGFNSNSAHDAKRQHESFLDHRITQCDLLIYNGFREGCLCLDDRWSCDDCLLVPPRVSDRTACLGDLPMMQDAYRESPPRSPVLLPRGTRLAELPERCRAEPQLVAEASHSSSAMPSSAQTASAEISSPGSAIAASLMCSEYGVAGATATSRASALTGTLAVKQADATAGSPGIQQA